MFAQGNKDYGSINRFSVATDDYRRRNSSAFVMDSDSKVGPQILAAFAGTYFINLFWQFETKYYKYNNNTSTSINTSKYLLWPYHLYD